MQGQRGSGGANPVHWNLGAGSGEVFMTKPRLLHPKKHMVPILQKGVGLGGCSDGTKNLAPTGIQLPDRSAYSESHIYFNVVYRLMFRYVKKTRQQWVRNL